jgi:hypothetical protein
MSNVTLTPTAIIGLGLLIFSLILLATPSRSGFARFLKFFLFLGILGISSFNLYTLIISNGNLFGRSNISMRYHYTVVATILIPAMTLSPLPYTLFDYLGAAANILTIITSLIGIIKELNGDTKKEEGGNY